MKMKCRLCHKLSEEDYYVIKWNEVVVCIDCADKLLEAMKKVSDEICHTG